MIAILCLLFSLAILYFVVRYRVHVHVTYTPRVDRRAARSRVASSPSQQGSAKEYHGDHSIANAGAGRRPVNKASSRVARSENIQAMPAREARESGDSSQRDIISALVNLGCSKSDARVAAEKAMSKGQADLEELLRRAIQEARAA